MLEGVQRSRVEVWGGGVEIAVLDWGGDGPLALLHHANGFCAATWAPVARALRDRFRVVALDARGHGASSRPPGGDAYRWNEMVGDLHAVADAILARLGRDRIALGLGHSFGGTLTLAAAARRPGLFEHLLLVDPVILPRPDGPNAEALRRIRRGLSIVDRARRRRQRWHNRDEARAYFAQRALFHRWHPAALELYVAEGLREREDGSVELACPRDVEAAVFEGSLGFDIHAEAPAAHLPVRLLWARCGDFPRAFYEELVEGLSDAVIEDVESAHLIPMERPDAVAEAALRQSGVGESPVATG